MYKKLPVVLALVCLGYISLQANSSLPESKALEACLTRAVANLQIDHEISYQNYKKQLSTVKDPSYNTLRPLFAGLTVYNQEFANAKTQQEREKLATVFSQEAWTGWNTYRAVSMMEIFDLYFPQENKDADIALLEYNIKSNILAKEKKNLITVFESMNDERVSDFKEPYHAFIVSLQAAKTYNPRAIIEALVPTIQSYNQLKKNFPEGAFLIRKSVVYQPFATGWGRTTSLDDLRYEIGMEEMSGGDYIHPHSVERLQSLCGVSAETAEIFFDFVTTYNQNR